MTIRRLHGRWLAEHPYAAIRENVARHPNADPTTLGLLDKDRSQPLWYLVALNPNTPAFLRRKLQDRLRQLGQSTSSKQIIQLRLASIAAFAIANLDSLAKRLCRARVRGYARHVRGPGRENARMSYHTL
jgi:hypothetical protein